MQRSAALADRVDGVAVGFDRLAEANPDDRAVSDDLAGLIDPGVIPVMRDQGRLIEYVLERQANYLVAFPSWYPAMARLPH